MLTDEVIRAIEAAVLSMTAVGEMFTAYDVTRSVREAGIRNRHAHIKLVVHAMFFQQTMPPHYVRTLCDLGGTYGPAWLYHRHSDDPTWYIGELLTASMLA